MFAKQLIIDDIIPLKTSDSGAYALNWMDENKVSHMPIVNDVEFLGLISDEDIFTLNNFEEALGNHQLTLSSPFVYDDQHLFEIIKIIAEHKLTLVPVLDSKSRYIGSITAQSLTQSLSKIAAVENPGGIIVLEVSNNDYSLSQIAQIVESNDAKVNNNITLVVNFQLEYFNTHSSKIILDIFKKLENINKKGHSVLVNWLYEIDDEDSLIAGEDYQSILKLPFNMIEIPD